MRSKTPWCDGDVDDPVDPRLLDVLREDPAADLHAAGW